MDLHSYFNPTTVDITIYGIGGVILDTVTAPADNIGIFWGVISDELITRINLYSPTETDGGDNFSFGVSPGPIDHIVVTPNPTTVTVGTFQQFNATAYDMFNNTVPGVDFTWDTDVGFLTPEGLFWAQPTPAVGNVTATNGTVTGRADVTVVAGPVDHIIVQPNPVSIQVGESQQFNATAYDIYGNVITGVGFIWMTDVGMINSTGFFTAQTVVGVGMVSATNGTVTGTAIVDVRPGPVDHIIVAPDPMVIMAGDPMPPFIVIAYDIYGNVITGGVNYTWTSNVWNETGNFILPPGEDGWLNITSGNCSYNVTVFVIYGPIDHIIVTPNPVTLPVGGSLQFMATAFDVFNNVIPDVSFIWTTDVGTVNSTGFFIAQPAPGTGNVTATNGSVSGSATVLIPFPGLPHIVVTPDPVTVSVGGTQQFTATAYDQFNNVIPGVGFIWTTDVGTVNATGFFTAQSTPATGTVTATNGTVDGSANVDVIDLTIDLNLGWNLISIPLEQFDESIDQVLASIDGKWDRIRAYDAFNDKWLSNLTSRPDSLNDLKTLNHKIGFWINIIEANVTLTLAGTLPVSTSIPLYAGWNLVGYPSLTDETVANALWGTGADQVEAFDAGEPYYLKEVGPDYLMKPGEGYWVHVPADIVWTIDW
jgi:hypothetical protein